MGDKKFFKCTTLIDGTGGNPVENAGILVEGKTILKIGKADTIDYGDAQVIELTGKTVMPGMINSHVHITMTPCGDPSSILESETDAKTAMRCIGHLQQHLKSGVTFFRDLGAPSGIDIDLRDARNQNLIDGPEFIVSGRCITMTGGHGHTMGRECDGTAEIMKGTREELKAGVDVIKIMATGGVMTKGIEPGSPQLTFEEIEASVIEAHKAGKKTATHAQGAIGIKNAVRAGIDSVEHGIYLDEEIINLMLEKGTYLVPTLAAPYFIIEAGVEGGVPEYAVKKSKQVMESHVASFKAAYKAGVKIALGTDAGTPYNLHSRTAFELKLMVEAGMAPMDAIVCATKGSADLLGITENYGTLEEGKTADFIVLNENPLQNISTIIELNCVYKHGTLVK